MDLLHGSLQTTSNRLLIIALITSYLMAAMLLRLSSETLIAVLLLLLAMTSVLLLDLRSDLATSTLIQDLTYLQVGQYITSLVIHSYQLTTTVTSKSLIRFLSLHRHGKTSLLELHRVLQHLQLSSLMLTSRKLAYSVLKHSELRQRLLVTTNSVSTPLLVLHIVHTQMLGLILSQLILVQTLTLLVTYSSVVELQVTS